MFDSFVSCVEDLGGGVGALVCVLAVAWARYRVRVHVQPGEDAQSRSTFLGLATTAKSIPPSGSQEQETGCVHAC